MGYSNTNPGGVGTIKIYMKNAIKSDFFKTKNTSFIVTNGFTKSKVFSNATFDTSKEFNYFGTLCWSSKIEIEANNSNEMKSRKANHKEIQVLIEGFSEDGELISEIKKFLYRVFDLLWLLHKKIRTDYLFRDGFFCFVHF